MSSEEHDELEQLLHPLRNPVALSGPETSRRSAIG